MNKSSKRILPKTGKLFGFLPGTPKTPGEAMAMISEGERLAETAKECDDLSAWERQQRAEAFITAGTKALEIRGDRDIHRVTGGELIEDVDEYLDSSEDEDKDCSYLIDSTKKPNMVGVEASQERLRLAAQNQCLEMALDASESIKGANSLEKMLAHQMAALHRMAMKILCQIGETSHPDNTVKLANASARLMTAYQGGMLTLARVRTGGKQEVVVQHINVNGDAQAVVAGKITGGKGGHRER
ncbi:MAG: hypothetical protein WCK00_15865 [Deltaproteobacteria bacterium]